MAQSNFNSELCVVKLFSVTVAFCLSSVYRSHDGAIAAAPLIGWVASYLVPLQGQSGRGRWAPALALRGLSHQRSRADVLAARGAPRLHERAIGQLNSNDDHRQQHPSAFATTLPQPAICSEDWSFLACFYNCIVLYWSKFHTCDPWQLSFDICAPLALCRPQG